MVSGPMPDRVVKGRDQKRATTEKEVIFREFVRLSV